MSVAGRRTVGGCGRAFVGVVATLVGLVIAPLFFGGIFLGLVKVGFLTGWEVGASLDAQRQLGITGPEGGPIVVSFPKCHQGSVEVVLLLGPDDSIMWRIEAPEPQPLDAFFVGLLPAGWAEVVPLTVPLDPATSYTVQVLPEKVDIDEAGVVSTLESASSATFAPEELRPDRVFVDRENVTQKEFDTSACG